MTTRSETLAREWLEKELRPLGPEVLVPSLAALLDRVREEERERIKGIVEELFPEEAFLSRRIEEEE